MNTTTIRSTHTAPSALAVPAARSSVQGVCTLAPGAAISLTPRAPTALRIAEGRAWVTLDDGPHRANGTRGEAAGDVFLHAGQTLWVATGQRAVVEPLDGQRLQYRLTGLAGNTTSATASTSLWQRLRGVGRQTPAAQDGTCCA